MSSARQMHISNSHQIILFLESKEEKQVQAKCKKHSRVSEAKVLNASSDLASERQKSASKCYMSWVATSFNCRCVSVRLRGIFEQVCGGNLRVCGGV